MRNEGVRFNRWLVAILLTSFVVSAFVVALDVGKASTSYEIYDSEGYPLLLANRWTADSCLMFIRQFSLKEFLYRERAYEWLLLGVHIVGGYLLVSKKYSTTRLTRWFFAVQFLIFPFGIPAIRSLPYITRQISDGYLNRIHADLPFFIFTAQPVWVIASIAIAVLMKGPRLGLGSIWNSHLRLWIATTAVIILGAIGWALLRPLPITDEESVPKVAKHRLTWTLWIPLSTFRWVFYNRLIDTGVHKVELIEGRRREELNDFLRSWSEDSGNFFYGSARTIIEEPKSIWMLTYGSSLGGPDKIAIRASDGHVIGIFHIRGD